MGTLPCSFLDSHDCHHIFCSWRRTRSDEIPRPQHFKGNFMPYNGSLSISAEHDYRQLALRLTIQVTIDLFDAV